MLEYPMNRDLPLNLAMKLLRELIQEEEYETALFYWNLNGTNEDMPNFWLKSSNLQVEWYRDNPDRGGFTNFENFSAQDAVSLLEIVREDYDIERDGK